MKAGLTDDTNRCRSVGEREFARVTALGVLRIVVVLKRYSHIGQTLNERGLKPKNAMVTFRLEKQGKPRPLLSETRQGRPVTVQSLEGLLTPIREARVSGEAQLQHPKIHL